MRWRINRSRTVFVGFGRFEQKNRRNDWKKQGKGKKKRGEIKKGNKNWEGFLMGERIKNTKL